MDTYLYYLNYNPLGPNDIKMVSRKKREIKECVATLRNGNKNLRCIVKSFSFHPVDRTTDWLSLWEAFAYQAQKADIIFLANSLCDISSKERGAVSAINRWNYDGITVYLTGISCTKDTSRYLSALLETYLHKPAVTPYKARYPETILQYAEELRTKNAVKYADIMHYTGINMRSVYKRTDTRNDNAYLPGRSILPEEIAHIRELWTQVHDSAMAKFRIFPDDIEFR